VRFALGLRHDPQLLLPETAANRERRAHIPSVLKVPPVVKVAYVPGTG
jgi:hypothetical protein